MAKLENVIVKRTKRGRLTEIEYAGVRFKLTSGKPRVGDIIKPQEEHWNFSPEGLYLCVGLDIEGDAEIELESGIIDTHHRKFYDVYRREGVTPDFAELERKVAAMDTRLEAVEKAVEEGNEEVLVNDIEVGDDVVALESSELDDIPIGTVGEVSYIGDYGEDDPYTVKFVAKGEVAFFKPDSLRKVINREARVGERIVITNAASFSTRYKNGDIFTVIGFSPMGNTLVNEHDIVIYTSEYLAIEEDASSVKTEEAVEPICEEDTFSEGDIVVITGNTNSSRNEVGDIGKITRKALNDNVSKWVDVPGRSGVGAYTTPKEMRHASTEEKAQYKKALEGFRIAEGFGVGDIVEVVKYNCGSPVGTLLKVERAGSSSIFYANDSCAYSSTTAKLVCKAKDIVKEDGE